MANLKSIKKGDKVIMRMFTGAFVDVKVVEMADAKKIGFTNKNGVKMVFDKATGKQITPEPKNPKYANFLDEYDEKVEADAVKKRSAGLKKAQSAPKKKKAEKPQPKQEVAEDFDEEDDDFDDEEIEEVEDADEDDDEEES